MQNFYRDKLAVYLDIAQREGEAIIEMVLGDKLRLSFQVEKIVLIVSSFFSTA